MSPTQRLALASSSCYCAPSSFAGRRPKENDRTCVKLDPARAASGGRAWRLQPSSAAKQSAPDEFAVARNAPLVIPPDYTLTPPVAGTAGADRRRTRRARRSRPCSAARRRAATTETQPARARRPRPRRRSAPARPPATRTRASSTRAGDDRGDPRRAGSATARSRPRRFRSKHGQAGNGQHDG